jgi:transcriptional regulator with XRE-family HTH domain
MKKPKKRRPNYIRAWRHHRGLTLEEVAERIEMTPGHLSMLERGQRSYVQETLEAVASALRTDAATLLMGDPHDPDAIWAIWDKAKVAQRKQITDMARRLLKGPLPTRASR